jgi:hypothetical protein
MAMFFPPLIPAPKWKWDELYVVRHKTSEARFHVNISFVDMFGCLEWVWLQLRLNKEREKTARSKLKSAAG